MKHLSKRGTDREQMPRSRAAMRSAAFSGSYKIEKFYALFYTPFFHRKLEGDTFEELMGEDNDSFVLQTKTSKPDSSGVRCPSIVLFSKVLGQFSVWKV